jgi:hypothetical protein
VSGRPTGPGGGDAMPVMTLISELGATEATVRVDGDRLWVPVDAVTASLGWEVKPEGLCLGDVCVPASGALQRDDEDRVDLVAVAAALHRPALLDTDALSVVVGTSAADRRGALRDRQLPSFTLPDLDGRLHHSDGWLGSKVLLAAFASW